ncbi:hypothetical protein ScPMuIL_000603 [Solemya velum]
MRTAITPNQTAIQWKSGLLAGDNFEKIMFSLFVNRTHELQQVHLLSYDCIIHTYRLRIINCVHNGAGTVQQFKKMTFGGIT